MEEDIFSVNADLTALRELEETLKANPDKEWFEYDGSKWIKEDYVIPKSLVKEKIEELEECVKRLGNGGIELTYKESAEAQIEVLQELLREE